MTSNLEDTTLSSFRKAKDICERYRNHQIRSDDAHVIEMLKCRVRSLLCGIDPLQSDFSTKARMREEKTVTSEWFADMHVHACYLLS